MAGSQTILDFLLSRTKRSTQPYHGNEIVAHRSPEEDDCEQVWNAVRKATMTSRERVVALCEAVDYIVDAEIEGDIVECGVWKGGSMMAAAKTLIRKGLTDRRLWLYDTFEGMNAPGDKDIDYLGNTAESLLHQHDPLQADSVWCRAALDEVKKNIRSTGYSQNLVNYVVGEVETTLRCEQNVPEKIALLRLDTDWYESTRVTLQHLYPRLQIGGVLIIDDYGHWKGCRQAVEEYFCQSNERPFLNRIDYTGRIAIKCPLHRFEAARAD